MSLATKKLSASALKILDCATALFAEKGFDGAIMDSLAERCDVNKASIYYHFQDKQNLYEVALTRLFAGVVDIVIANTENQSSASEKLDAFVRGFAQAASEQPKMPAMLMREIAAGGITMPAPARMQMQRLLHTLKAIIEQGVAEGVFRYADPLMLQFMIIGSFSFHITSEPMRRAIVSENSLDPTLSEAIEHVSALVQQALRILPEESNP
jgi:AcrR family transcriptional regulator